MRRRKKKWLVNPTLSQHKDNSNVTIKNTKNPEKSDDYSTTKQSKPHTH